MFNTENLQQKFTKLNNGHQMPRIGYGTFDIVGLPLKEAILTGYRHIDAAKMYDNEELLGNTLKELFTNGTVKREDLFITSKITNEEKDDVEKAITETLKRLQLDYLDLYIIHWPVGEIDLETGKVKKQTPLHVTWKALEEQVRAGRVRSIGVSNFNVQLLLDLLSYAEIKPVCNQFEVHPYFTQEDLIGFCKKNDIEVVAYTPLGGNGPENPKFTSKNLVEEPVIKELAAKYNKTPGQVILNWHLSRGYVIIPKSVNKLRIKENFESDTFEMEAEDYKKVSALNQNSRVVDPKNFGSFAYLPVFA